MAESTSQQLTLCVARITLGTIALAHGLSYTFGMFGGPGIEQFATEMEARISVAPALTSHVVAFGLLFIGVSLVFGPLARFSALLGLLLVASITFFGARYTTFWAETRGMEWMLALAALSQLIMIQGPGAFCLDLGKLMERLKGSGKAKPKKV